jgi:peptide/nickel transport system substrate-binding protein
LCQETQETVGKLALSVSKIKEFNGKEESLLSIELCVVAHGDISVQQSIYFKEVSTMQKFRWWVVVSLLVVVGVVYVPFGMAQGGTLRIANPTDIIKLDPIYIQDAPSSRVAGLIYDNLVEHNYDGTLRPALAKSWEVSDDATSYTFYLHEGVGFHDGTLFNAQAVKSHFDRLTDPEWASPQREMYAELIEKIEVLGQYTIRFDLTRPDVTFIESYLITNASMIASPAAVEMYGEDIALNPVGTGEFIFKEYREAEFVELVKNEDYWGGEPKLDGVIFKPIPELATRLVELETGGVDLIYRVPLEELERLEREEEIVVQKDPYASIRGLWFQQGHFSPFADVRVRRALAHGLNIEEIYEAFLKGVAVLGNSVVPVKSWAYHDAGRYEYDPEKAKTLLEEAGWVDTDGDGVREKEGQELRFTIMSPDGRYLMDKEICEAAMHQWKGIGVAVDVDVLEWGTWVGRVFAKEFDMVFLGWMQSTFEPALFLDALVKTGGRAALWDYSNPELDEILTQAVAVSDLEKRKELYAKAQEIIYQNVVWIGLYNHLGMVAHTAHLKGYRYTCPREDFTVVWIED